MKILTEQKRIYNNEERERERETSGGRGSESETRKVKIGIIERGEKKDPRTQREISRMFTMTFLSVLKNLPKE